MQRLHQISFNTFEDKIRRKIEDQEIFSQFLTVISKMINKSII